MQLVNGAVDSRLLSVRNWLLALKFSEGDIMPMSVAVAEAFAAGKANYSLHMCANFNTSNTLQTDPTLSLISQNDAFAPVAIRQMVRKRVGTNYAIAEFANYPDKTIFNFAGENDQIKGVFGGGVITLKVETSTIIEAIQSRQLSSAIGIQAAAAAVASLGNPSQYDSYVNLQKDVLLSGSADAVIDFNLKGFTPVAAIIGDSGVATEANDVFIELIGFVVKGGGKKASQLASEQDNTANCVIRGL